jgi:hypothetical protein
VKIESDDTGQYPDKNRIGRVKPVAKPNVVKLATNGAATSKAELNDEIPF